MLLASLGYSATAQISEARLPQSMLAQIREQYIPLTKYALPDWKTAKDGFEKEEANGFSRPFLFGLPVATDLSFPASGTLVTLPNGKQVWRAQVKIEGAPAMGFYYNKFELPKGVSYFLSNENGRHILGAYTSENNSEDLLFANEAVQGELVTLELDIDPGVNLSDIKLHIDRILVYFRSYEYLNQYLIDDKDLGKPTDVDDLHLEGGGSACGINAICPLGVNYPMARKATVQTIYLTGSLCSGTMVNSVGNSEANCKQYLLTATHCEPDNRTGTTPFSQMLIRYNFEKKQCGSGPAAQVNTLTGANFKARANYIETATPEIDGDFLLLEVKTKIPASWDVYFAGWNRATTMPASLTYPKRYIGFHHPAGDIKKVSVSNDISPDGEAGGSLGPGTHWQIYPVDSGGVEGGSSGSGLFDGEGRLIGIASVAGDPDPGCTATGQPGGSAAFFRYVQYSKLSLDWDYSLDGPDNSRKLQPWLDPNNSGVITIDPVKSTCATAGSGITTQENNLLDNAIAIAPNPATSGKITATVNFSEPAPLIVDIYNIAGAKQATYNVGKVSKGTYTFDLSGYANGMYLLKFNNGNAIATKKVMLAH